MRAAKTRSRCDGKARRPRFYLNGTLLQTMPGNTLAAGTQIGLFAFSGMEPGVDTRWDNVAVYHVGTAP